MVIDVSPMLAPSFFKTVLYRTVAYSFHEMIGTVLASVDPVVS